MVVLALAVVQEERVTVLVAPQVFLPSSPLLLPCQLPQPLLAGVVVDLDGVVVVQPVMVEVLVSSVQEALPSTVQHGLVT